MLNGSTFVVLDGAEIINDGILLNYNSGKMKRHLPMLKIKKASYKNFGPAVPIGVGSGILAGGITATIVS